MYSIPNMMCMLSDFDLSQTCASNEIDREKKMYNLRAATFSPNLFQYTKCITQQNFLLFKEGIISLKNIMSPEMTCLQQSAFKSDSENH